MEIVGFGNSVVEQEQGHFAVNDNYKNIRQMLDSPNVHHTLNGMKQILAILSKGLDVSMLFPDVVKNVGNKNLEVKKLVYLYLVHYAELQSELALLSINTFQKDLADSNPVIRALALRVLSSIRLKVIVQIVVLSIQKCVNDSSPYVKKAAAHAITKVYALDAEQKPTLVELIATLLLDRNIICLGSAVAAFNAVCPGDWSLIHPHYQKLCHTLIDMDEWSQVHLLEMLTRYGRVHFLNPNLPEEENERLNANRGKAWNSDSEEDAAEEAKSGEEKDNSYEELDRLGEMDGDHRLLLNCSSPLLNSINDSVVLAVVNLLVYLAPVSESQRVGRAVVRILRNDPEIQQVVLTTVVSIAANRPSIFTGSHMEFYVRGGDPHYVRKLKLEVLTHLADETNIHHILREFNHYTVHDDQSFVSASVRAIGRCAAMIPPVADQCMQRLMAFLQSPSSTVVAESVLVIRRLLQLYTGKFQDSVPRLASLLDKIDLPRARAALIYIVAHSKEISTYGPDVLRKLAKSFHEETAAVKLQALNLGVKLYHLNKEQIDLLFRYVLDMSSYDSDYDVRDKARLIRAAVFSCPQLGQFGNQLFLTQKPTPKFLDPSNGRERFARGAVSHVLNRSLPMTLPVSEFPKELTEKLIRAKEARVLVTYDTTSMRPHGGGSDWTDSDEWETGDEWESDSGEPEDSDASAEAWLGEPEEEDGFGSIEDSDEAPRELSEQEQEDTAAAPPVAVAFDDMFGDAFEGEEDESPEPAAESPAPADEDETF